ncbi:hypothetical protein [Bacillus sp. AK128]
MDFDKKIEFIRSSVEHVEKRIEVMDQKASILMAIQAGYFILITTLLKDFVGIFNVTQQTSLLIGIFSYAFLFASFLFSFYIVYYLIMTIRPGEGIIQNKITEEVTGKIPVANYIFWFKNKGKYLTDEEYLHIVDNLSDQDVLDNYKKTHFTGLQLLSKKYAFYRQAIKAMNYFIILNVIGVTILFGYSFIEFIRNV